MLRADCRRLAGWAGRAFGPERAGAADLTAQRQQLNLCHLAVFVSARRPDRVVIAGYRELRRYDRGGTVPSSLLFAGLVATWLAVLVPMAARRRQPMTRPSDAALSCRVLERPRRRKQEVSTM